MKLRTTSTWQQQATHLTVRVAPLHAMGRSLKSVNPSVACVTDLPSLSLAYGKTCDGGNTGRMTM